MKGISTGLAALVTLTALTSARPARAEVASWLDELRPSGGSLAGGRTAAG